MNEVKTILVTSHDHDQFGLAASMFEENGYRVIFERDVQQSVKIAKAELPNLIISELAVPDIDGPRFCRSVRENTALERTPIVLVGDLSRRSSIVRDSLRSGASDYLQKPFDPIELFDLCQNAESGEARVNYRSSTSQRPDAPIENFGSWAIVKDLICVN